MSRPGEPPRAGAARRAAAALAAFAAGFLAIGALLSRAAPPVAGDARIDWLRAHGDAFDTLFVGSSRTARQVVPAEFDAAMAAAGLATRSFNLGLPGMRAPEDGYVLERALGARRAPLRFVVVECGPLRIGIPPGDEGSARAVYWHDGPRVAALVRGALAQRGGAGSGAALLALEAHLRHFAWNALRLGRGADLLRGWLGDPPEAADLGPGGDGYRPGRDRAFVEGADLAHYLAELARAEREPHTLVYGDAESQAELRRKQALAARHGARLVLVAPPIPVRSFAPRPELDAVFLDFSDPRRFPELFAREQRKDSGHLNPRGAALYSRLLARELAAAAATATTSRVTP